MTGADDFIRHMQDQDPAELDRDREEAWGGKPDTRASLDRETIRSLLAEHRNQAGDEEIVARPGGGWLIVTASHVLSDGRMDDSAGTRQCLAMYDEDNASEVTP